jgi:hypothetical protein
MENKRGTWWDKQRTDWRKCQDPDEEEGKAMEEVLAISKTQEVVGSMEELKLRNLIGTDASNTSDHGGPLSGLTTAVPRFQEDLEAVLLLSQSKKPILRCIQSCKCGLTAFYGFGDASFSGFGSLVQRPYGLFMRFGIWPSDVEDKSSNYRKLRHLVEAVEEEAKEGYLTNFELWLFTDNSSAESCFHKGSSSSRALHDLVLRLEKTELEAGFTLYIVHIARTCMIAQGTNGLSQGIILEGVMSGENMLQFVP